MKFPTVKNKTTHNNNNNNNSKEYKRHNEKKKREIMIQTCMLAQYIIQTYLTDSKRLQLFAPSTPTEKLLKKRAFYCLGSMCYNTR